MFRRNITHKGAWTVKSSCKKNGSPREKRARFHLFWEAFCYRPWFFVLYVIRALLMAVLPFSGILAVKLLVDELSGGRDIEKMVRIAIVYCIAAFVLNGGIAVIRLLGDRWSDSFNRYFDRLLCEKCMLLDYEALESPELLGRVEKAKNGINASTGGIRGVTDTLLGMISDLLMVGGVVSIIAANTPWLLVIVLLPTLLCAVLAGKINKVNIAAQRKGSELQRIYRYIFTDLTEPRYAKDIQLYDAGGFIAGKTGDYKKEYVNGVLKKQAKDRSVPVLLSGLLDILYRMGGYIYLGVLLVMGALTLGNFTMLATSAQTMSEGVRGFITKLQTYAVQRELMRDYTDFMRMPLSQGGERQAQLDGEHTVEFCDVSFKYPRSDSYSLQHCSLTIKSGERLAIVGVNGAGKTTFIKLLCGLYAPTEGTILIDGIDIRDYDKRSLYELFSVVFQDFNVIAYEIGENIAIKSEPDEADRRHIFEIADTVNFSEKLRSLPKELDTVLFKIFDDNGVELSGGERQKLAIVRAIYKDAPIVILDEPTAALDPIAENEVYTNFDKLVGKKTAIYISHRMSSTRFCDRIVVFEDGAIVEIGSHDELMKNGGIYARMFSAQANFYN